MFDDRNKKVIVKTSDGGITRLAHKYQKLNTQLRDVKEQREETLNALRDTVLRQFDPEDEDKTRVLQTNSVRVSINKRTIRNVVKTDMEKVFENISELYKIPRIELDNVVEANTTVSEVEVKPTVKVSE
jgi:hypothetical protein